MYNNRPLTARVNDYIEKKKKMLQEELEAGKKVKGLTVDQRHWLEVTSRVAYQTFNKSDFSIDDLKNVDNMYKIESRRTFKTVVLEKPVEEISEEDQEEDQEEGSGMEDNINEEEDEGIELSLWDLASLSYAICISSPKTEVEHSRLDRDVYMKLAYVLYNEVCIKRNVVPDNKLTLNSGAVDSRM